MKSPRAFSLVEVVLALGIFAFAIIALFGLISASLQSSRESASDLSLGLMTQTVSSVLKMEGFASAATNAAYGTNTSDIFFFNSDGELARGAGGKPVSAAQTNSFFTCAVTRVQPAGLSTTNALAFRVVFSWPHNAPRAQRQTRTVLTSLANYE